MAEACDAQVVVFGSINIDIVCRVDTIPAPGETVLSAGYTQSFGGKGANQAVAAARALGPAGRVVMVGAVGDDEFGRQAVENLARHGIQTDAVERVRAATGCAFINVALDGENAITVASGANACINPDALPPLPDAGRTVVVMQMETPVEANLRVARAAKAAGAKVILNLAPARFAGSAAALRQLLEATDILVVNEHELRVVAHLNGLSACGAMEELTCAVSAALNAEVVATAGAAGAYLSAGTDTPLTVSAPRVEVRDTTGAGDCLTGILAAGLAEGLELPAALGRAVVGASMACLQVGAQASMPDRSALSANGPRTDG